MSDKKIFRRYKADKSLQLKVGPGPLDQKTLAYCEEIIRRNKVDFTEIGNKYLDRLNEAITQCTQDNENNTYREELIAVVMEFKANAAIFHYPLITQLSDLMLTFLEKRSIIDKDIIALLDVYKKTLKIILSGAIRKDDREAGAALISELRQAIERHHQKYGDE